MVVRKTAASVLEMNDAANAALERIMKQLLIYATVLKKNTTIKKDNAALIEQLEALAKQINALQIKAKQQKPIARNELDRVARIFVNVNEVLRKVKFEDPQGLMLKRLGKAVMVGAKSINQRSAQKDLDRIQDGLQNMGESIRKDMDVLVKNVQPKQRTFWEKLIDTFNDFTQTCRKLFTTLLNKKKKEMDIVLVGGQKGSPPDRLQQQIAQDSGLAVQQALVLAMKKAETKATAKVVKAPQRKQPFPDEARKGMYTIAKTKVQKAPSPPPPKHRQAPGRSSH